MREVFAYLSLNYFVLAKTEINDDLSDLQFLLESFEILNRRDRRKMGVV